MVQISITHIFLFVLLVVSVGYALHKRSIKNLQKQIAAAEDAAGRSDQDYLAVIKENEELKQEILKQQNDEVRIISLQELLKKKKA